MIIYWIGAIFSVSNKLNSFRFRIYVLVILLIESTLEPQLNSFSCFFWISDSYLPFNFDGYIVQLNLQRLKSYCELFLFKKTHDTPNRKRRFPFSLNLFLLYSLDFLIIFLFFHFVSFHHLINWHITFCQLIENAETIKRSSLNFFTVFVFLFYFISIFPLGKKSSAEKNVSSQNFEFVLLPQTEFKQTNR